MLASILLAFVVGSAAAGPLPDETQPPMVLGTSCCGACINLSCIPCVIVDRRFNRGACGQALGVFWFDVGSGASAGTMVGLFPGLLLGAAVFALAHSLSSERTVPGDVLYLALGAFFVGVLATGAVGGCVGGLVGIVHGLTVFGATVTGAPPPRSDPPRDRRRRPRRAEVEPAPPQHALSVRYAP